MIGPEVAGFPIAAELSISASHNYCIVPMAVGGLVSYWLKVK